MEQISVNEHVEIARNFSIDGNVDEFTGCSGYVARVSGGDALVELHGGREVWVPMTRLRRVKRRTKGMGRWERKQ